LIAACFEVGDVVGDGVDAFCFHDGLSNAESGELYACPNAAQPPLAPEGLQFGDGHMQAGRQRAGDVAEDGEQQIVVHQRQHLEVFPRQHEDLAVGDGQRIDGMVAGFDEPHVTEISSPGPQVARW